MTKELPNLACEQPTLAAQLCLSVISFSTTYYICFYYEECSLKMKCRNFFKEKNQMYF